MSQTEKYRQQHRELEAVVALVIYGDVTPASPGIYHPA